MHFLGKLPTLKVTLNRSAHKQNYVSLTRCEANRIGPQPQSYSLIGISVLREDEKAIFCATNGIAFGIRKIIKALENFRQQSSLI